MILKENENGYFLESNPYFKPQLFFDCGQSFRFFNCENGAYTGVAFGNVIEIKEEKNGWIITTSGKLEKNILEDFFDLKRDYGQIENFLKKDETMKNAVDFGRGIRILKQDFFEILLTFIYSQRSNIPKIAKCTEETSRLFGDKIIYKGKEYYAFPTPKQMKNITEKDLETVKCGYRSPYIVDAVNKVNSGEITFENLKNLPYEKVKEKLMTIKGVGEKVADCVCLFSFGFFEAFPTDTWIKKAMKQLYGVEEKQIKETSDKMFGNLSGIAQQYLFYYLRYKK